MKNLITLIALLILVASPFKGLPQGINVNPLGLLQFGPIVQYEAKVSSSSVIVPYFRYAYLGLLTHLVWTEFEDDAELSPATFGVGLGIKAFSKETGNTLYYGGFLDYNIAKATYDVGEADETEEKFSGLGIISNIGYRWRKSSGNHFNLGLFAGVNLTLSDKEYFVRTGELYDSHNETTFFAMLELSFGFGGK